MIKQTQNTISAAVATELNLASQQYGKHFSSPHEGYGVLMEEVWEARVHTRAIESLAEHLLTFLHNVESCPDAYMHQLEKIKEQAISGAAELCQVAAMCEKGMRSMRNMNDERKE